MNIIDQHGLGRTVLALARDEKLSSFKITQRILQDYKVFIGERSIRHYLKTFQDPNTGKYVPDEKFPDVPDWDVRTAQDVHAMLEERQINDVNILEVLSDQAMAWFYDPDIPINMKLRIIKELRDTIRLKLELGGLVKPTAPASQTNNFIMGKEAIEKLLVDKPESIGVIRDLLYLMTAEKATQVIDITPASGDGGE